ncbi:PP2C family protein-serine/threonine phosphatase [Nocardia australiensis]|uniref:PP2C family protein-serine/threonine phosphatase n=1 Tax=Nocardia australiensis TaxID=2887191 RepID=UPI001D15A469|nr:phosphatase [Nocardia australiensis]
MSAERNTRTGIRCAGCAASVGATDRYCEACGRELGARRIALPQPEPEAVVNCEGCGGQRYDADGYCRDCGQLRPEPDRHAADLGAVCVVTDRGIAHVRNEDAVAAAVVDSGVAGVPATTVMVVCDGVSTSEDPQAASGAGVRAGVDASLVALAEGGSGEAVVMAGLAAAAKAVRDTAVHAGHAPSCTYVSALVRDLGDGSVEITVANVGDSRAYWLPADTEQAREAAPSQRLSADDSWAQALVDAGAMDEAGAMKDPRAHTLLRWLGADSDATPWSDRCVRTLRTTGPGVVLLCSDGLWNYQSDPVVLAAMATADVPLSAARELVDFAIRSGGSDNITVALAPVGYPEQPGEVQ